VMTPVTGQIPFTPATNTLEPEEEAEEENEGVEEESDLIKRFTLQNLFTPQNAQSLDKSFDFNRVSSPVTQFISSTPSVQTPSATPSISTEVKSVSKDRPTSVSEWITRLGATAPLIHNVVATANLGIQLDLKKIALTARNAEYNPRRFAAVIMRIREPKSTALVFKSGKLVVTGTKSEEDARRAARKFGRVIMKVGYQEARFKDFRIENLVSTFTVPFPIHLEQLYKDLPPTAHSQYEPEVFPGLIYKAPMGTLLIFVSGKCVMIGMRTREDLDRAFVHVMPFLEEHRKK